MNLFCPVLNEEYRTDRCWAVPHAPTTVADSPRPPTATEPYVSMVGFRCGPRIAGSCEAFELRANGRTEWASEVLASGFSLGYNQHGMSDSFSAFTCMRFVCKSQIAAIDLVVLMDAKVRNDSRASQYQHFLTYLIQVTITF